MNRFVDQVYFNNTVADYITALSIIVFGTLLLRLLRNALIKRLKHWTSTTTGSVDDAVVRSLDRFGLAALQYAVIYWGISSLTLTEKVARVMQVATSVVVTYFILRLLSASILILLQNRIKRQERGEDKIKQLGGLMIIINILIWIIGLVFLFDNLGYNVTTIITGLGIGGIAVALAAQNILGDLFNYFVIFFDRPFEAGDFIVVDDKSGNVEYVGIKTTRIRSLGGEQIIIGNSNLTSARIHNFKRLLRRRVVFTIDVEYQTPLEKLKLIPELLKKIVSEHQPITFDRAHFAAYGDWSLKFEVVYWVEDADFNKHMDIRQNINFRIMEEFEKLDIEFAFPTQTLMLPHQNEFVRDDRENGAQPSNSTQNK